MPTTELSDYKHKISIPVRFMDIDALQHVNNARYLNFLEEARIAYSQDLLGIFNSIKELNVLVARIEIDFMRPILYGQKMTIYTRIDKMGTKSFVFDCAITANDGKQEFIAAKAKQVMVMFDVKAGKSIGISQEMKEEIYKIEPHLKD